MAPVPLTDFFPQLVEPVDDDVEARRARGGIRSNQQESLSVFRDVELVEVTGVERGQIDQSSPLAEDERRCRAVHPHADEVVSAAIEQLPAVLRPHRAGAAVDGNRHPITCAGEGHGVDFVAAGLVRGVRDVPAVRRHTRGRLVERCCRDCRGAAIGAKNPEIRSR
jgi:hypothetical protein